MTRIALTIAVAATAAFTNMSSALANVGSATNASVRTAVTDSRDAASRLLLQHVRSQNSDRFFKKVVR